MSPERYLPLMSLGGHGDVRVWLGVLRGAAGYRRPVVLKRALPSVDEEDERQARAALEREAKLSAALEHPNLVHAVELFEHADGLTLSMQYVHGMSLHGVLDHLRRTDGVMPWPVAARIVADAARGLAYAHDAHDFSGTALGIIHRDVSPKNLLVAEGGWTKVVDFGIARAAGDTATRDGLVRGTLGYFSPEQARGEPLDARTDVFSLGVVLYELLTGARPFERPTLEESLEAMLREPLPAVPGEVPPVVCDVLSWMLSRDRAQRTVTMSRAADALEQAAGQWGTGHGTVATFLRAEVGPDLERRRQRLAQLLDGSELGLTEPVPGEDESTLERLEQALDTPVSAASTVAGERTELDGGVGSRPEDDTLVDRFRTGGR